MLSLFFDVYRRKTNLNADIRELDKTHKVFNSRYIHISLKQDLLYDNSVL